MFKEFKEFAVRGNVMDLAIGVIIGAAFTKIVDSLVKDILTPPLGLVLARVDLSNLEFVLSRRPDEVAIRYGAFLNELIQFGLVAFALFIFVRQVNRIRRRPEQLPPTTKECPFCISLISVNAIRCPNCTSELPAAD